MATSLDLDIKRALNLSPSANKTAKRYISYGNSQRGTPTRYRNKGAAGEVEDYSAIPLPTARDRNSTSMTLLPATSRANGKNSRIIAHGHSVRLRQAPHNTKISPTYVEGRSTSKTKNSGSSSSSNAQTQAQKQKPNLAPSPKKKVKKAAVAAASLTVMAAAKLKAKAEAQGKKNAGNRRKQNQYQRQQQQQQQLQRKRSSSSSSSSKAKASGKIPSKKEAKTLHKTATLKLLRKHKDHGENSCVKPRIALNDNKNYNNNNDIRNKREELQQQIRLKLDTSTLSVTDYVIKSARRWGNKAARSPVVERDNPSWPHMAWESHPRPSGVDETRFRSPRTPDGAVGPSLALTKRKGAFRYAVTTHVNTTQNVRLMKPPTPALQSRLYPYSNVKKRSDAWTAHMSKGPIKPHPDL